MKILAPGFYTNVFGIGFLALFLFAIVVPTMKSMLGPRGKPQFRLTEAEMADAKMAADMGNAEAARRIYKHFVYYERRYTNAHQWLERAAVLGDEPAKKYMKDVYDSAGLEGYRQFIGLTNEAMEVAFLQSVSGKTNGSK